MIRKGELITTLADTAQIGRRITVSHPVRSHFLGSTRRMSAFQPSSQSLHQESTNRQFYEKNSHQQN